MKKVMVLLSFFVILSGFTNEKVDKTINEVKEFMGGDISFEEESYTLIYADTEGKAYYHNEDRLARNTKEALNIIEELLEKDIAINVLNMGKIENTSIGKLIYTVLLSVAELERDMILERTQEGKAYAKIHNPNFKEGRPKRKLSVRYLKAIDILQTNSIAESATITGISVATLKRIRKQYKDEVSRGERKAEFQI